MASELNKNWHHWENRRSHKIKPLNYFYILLLSFFAFFPLMQNNLLWNEYDTVNRSFFSTLDSWTSIFSGSVFWNDNPIALISYFIEGLIPLPEAFTHRLINILLHSSAAMLLFRLLNRMHVSGAFLTALIFTVHPVTVQTIFWPGYRSIIIVLCLALWCLYLALDRKNKKNPRLAFWLSGLTAILHPIALIIPLVLFLQSLVKNKQFKLENFKKIIPYIVIVFAISILSKIFEGLSIDQLNGISSESDEQMPSFSYQLFEYLMIIYFPFGSAFFNPINHQTFFLLHLIPYFFFLITSLALFFTRNFIWSRLLIMGVSLLFALLAYACSQNGLFLDGGYALDDSLVYITLIPAIALVSCSINAIVVHKAPQLKILWYSLVGILIIILTGLSFSRSLHYSKPFKTWEYFNVTWSDSVTPKKALSDHLFNNGYNKYRMKDHIYFLEFILRKAPENNEQKLQLAELYIKNGQSEEAQNLYNRIVFDDQVRDRAILEEAADFFELQGLYIDARRTRELLNEIVQ